MSETTQPTPTLREAAKSAWELEKAKNAQRAENRMLSDKNDFIRSLKGIGILADIAEVKYIDGVCHITIEGIHFFEDIQNRSYSTERYLSIGAVCRHCAKTINIHVNSLGVLGQVLETGDIPDYLHRDGKCTQAPAPSSPSLAEQLEDIVRQIAREEMPAYSG